MSYPSQHASHITITDEMIASHREMRTNLVLAVAVTALAWTTAASYTVQNGFHPLVLYLFIGSVEALRNLALVPLHYLDRKRPAVHSLIQYGKTMLVWFPHAVYVTYLGVRDTLGWDVEDFRVIRMLERAQRHADTMTEEEFLEGTVDER